MKIKHFLLTTSVLCPVAFVLRLIQYFTVIDENGYFLHGSTLKTIISVSVYGIIAIAAILAVITAFSKPKIAAEYDCAVGGKSLGVLFVVSAVIIMITSGIFFTTASYRFSWPITPESIPNLLTVISAVLGVLSAIHFAFVGMSAMSGNKWAIARKLGIISPLYFAVYGIREFYSTFDSAGKSETKIFMLSVCMTALFIMSLVLSHVGSEIFYNRIAGSAGILAVVTAITGPAFLISMLVGKADFNIVYFLQTLLHTALMVIAFTILTRLSFINLQAEADEIEPIEFSPLDKFLNEIPDEDRGNDE